MLTLIRASAKYEIRDFSGIGAQPRYYTDIQSLSGEPLEAANCEMLCKTHNQSKGNR